jgi:hypothetical protein
LNDSQVVQFGKNAFRRLWEHVKPSLIDEAPFEAFEEWLDDIEGRAALREVLVVCACADANSLLHWRAYAQIDDGYAIELSATAEHKVLAPSGRPQLFQPDDVPAIFWRTVIYGEKDPEWDWTYGEPTRSLVEGALDAFGSLEKGRVLDEPLMRDLLDRQYLALVCAFKHEGFATEQEQRIIVVRPVVSGFTSERESRYGPATKALLAAVDGSHPELYTVDRITKLPILSVQLAAKNPEGDEARVRDLLDSEGYVGVLVSRSSTPIR